MITSASRPLPHRLAADVVIIGAGPAGLAVTSRVRASGCTAIVLEAGGHNPVPEPDAGRARVDGRLPYFDLARCRPRGLGGSTTLWGGWCEPFDELDLRERPIHYESGWCVSAATLAPYFREAGVFCRIPQHVPSRPWERADDLAAGGWPFELRSFPVLGPRQLGHLHQDLFSNEAAALILDATVTRVVTTPDGGAVDHLVIACPDGERAVTAGQFVLAAGGIESSRLLLYSRSGAWPMGLGNGHDLVGRCFMEHPHVDALRVRGDRAFLDLDYFQERSAGMTLDGVPMATVGSLLLSEKACDEYKVARAQLFIEPAGDHRRHPIPRVRDGRPFHLPVAETTDNEIAAIVVTEQLANRESRVVLGDQTDRYGMPLPVLRWRLTESDHRTALVGTEQVRELLLGLGVGEPRRRLPRHGWPLDTLGGPHHLGTIRMARSPADGVVDEDCRVHGVCNLFVAGGAVFPTSGHAPPTLTIIALALRLGDHLSQQASVPAKPRLDMSH